MHTSTTSPGQWPCNRTRSLMQRASGAAGSCRKLWTAVTRCPDIPTWGHGGVFACIACCCACRVHQGPHARPHLVCGALKAHSWMLPPPACPPSPGVWCIEGSLLDAAPPCMPALTCCCCCACCVHQGPHACMPALTLCGALKTPPSMPVPTCCGAMKAPPLPPACCLVHQHACPHLVSCNEGPP